METCPICSINIFTRLEGKEVHDLNDIVTIKKYAKGDVVFHHGAEGAKLHLLFEGQLKSVRYSEEGKETVLHMIEKGEPFALVPCFLNIPYTATCVALQTSEVGVIKRDDFIDLLKKHPEISLKIMAGMAQRTKDLLTRIEVQTSLPPKERLMNYLEGEAHTYASKVFDLTLSKADLARLLGMEPETLSRSFSILTNEKFIQIDKKRITIL